MSGQLVQYERRTEPDDPAGFRLWSVGVNGRDDGGVMVPNHNDARGDWVWPNRLCKPRRGCFEFTA